jgi:putative heme-binding domain-containing protein
MLAELLRDPGDAAPLLVPLAKSMAGRGNEAELALALGTAVQSPAEVKSILQGGLAKARQKPLAKPAANSVVAATPAPASEVSDQVFRQFVTALDAPRDLKRGHEVFAQSCAICHRVSEEGHVFGPDLLGELGAPEETLIRHLLLPNERIRPGFETVLIETTDGAPSIGILKEDGATSVTLAKPGGGEEVVLKKDIGSRSQLTTSLMPSFAATLTPADVANLLAWLRSQLSGVPR